MDHPKLRLMSSWNPTFAARKLDQERIQILEKSFGVHSSDDRDPLAVSLYFNATPTVIII